MIKSLNDRYNISVEYLKRACKTIPLGSQTFSKSKMQYPVGVSPFFAKKSQGAYLWDVDGNKYVDFVNALASITLGYNDPDVAQSVKEQLECGTIFSFAHELEFIVAEKICEMVPCAEMVRFGKNGSDATTGAVRIARAYTNRDHILVCGYHGWQDWYIGSTSRDLGIPNQTKALTHTFQFNNIDSLDKLFKKLKNHVAGVILEPVNAYPPTDNFLEKVKELTHKNGALLIFDETITGFRYANGGAQEFFNVIPDLATFGKGLANGYPLSAVAGKSEYMALMEEVFFSFTFGGETLSLAAANATLDKLKQFPVINHFNEIGKEIISGLENLIDDFKMNDIFKVSGYPVWSFFLINNMKKYNSWELKTLFLQEMLLKEVVTIGTHNLSYSHNTHHVDQLLNAYTNYFEVMSRIIKGEDLYKFLRCKPLKPLFKVR